MLANQFDKENQRHELAPWLQEMQEKHSFAELMPMSAKNAKDIQRLLVQCEKYLPEQAWWYAEDELTDRSEKFMAAEMVREKLFRLLGDELPYICAVSIDNFVVEGRLRRIAASIIVDKESHKGIVVGAKGSRLREIGTLARLDMEKLFGGKVHLELWVRVKGGWSDDDRALKQLGYD